MNVWHPATTSILHKPPRRKTHPTHSNILIRSVRTLAAHKGASRPKHHAAKEAWESFQHLGMDGRGWACMADGGLGEGWQRWRSWGNPGPTRCTQPRNSRLHRRPRVLTRGPSTRAMAHCTLISRPIQKHGDRFRGQACCKQHASPTRLWEEEAHPPCCESHHSLRCHLTRPGRRGIPWCIQWGPTRAIATSFCALPFVRQKGGCVQCAGPRPTVGSGVARVALAQLVSGGSMVVFECFGQRQRTALTPPPQPKRYPACRKCIFKQVSSGRLRAGVGPWAVSGAAASCQTIETT